MGSRDSMGGRDRSNIGGGFIFETSGRGSAEAERLIDEKNGELFLPERLRCRDLVTLDVPRPRLASSRSATSSLQRATLKLVCDFRSGSSVPAAWATRN